MAEELSEILTAINESLASCGQSLEKLENTDEVIVPKRLESLLGDERSHKVSLLSLKNGSMLSYLNALLLLLGDKLGKEPTGEKGRRKTVEQRVVLERGVKPLERKLGYQLDKLTRSYNKMEKEMEEAKKRAEEKSQHAGDSDLSDSESDEEMNYRPNATSMLKGKKGTKSTAEPDRSDAEHSDRENEDAIYKPPKISAVLPPKSHHFEDKFNAQDHKDKSSRSRMQAMEEYLKEASDQPELEASIGTNIINHGRGGMKSSRDTERERQVKTYEEDNFTRLNTVVNKAEKRKQKQRERIAKVNTIGGEDFSIFSSKRKLEDSTSRRGSKKSRNAWERAKKRL